MQMFTCCESRYRRNPFSFHIAFDFEICKVGYILVPETHVFFSTNIQKCGILSLENGELCSHMYILNNLVHRLTTSSEADIEEDLFINRINS